MVATYTSINNTTIYMFILTIVPASPPTNAMTNVTSSTEVLVIWDIVTPINQNGIITMYEVLYQPQETFGGAVGPLVEMVVAPTLSVTLTQLQEYVVYSVSIRAFTQAGPSGYTAALQARTLQDGNDCMHQCAILTLCILQFHLLHPPSLRPR